MALEVIRHHRLLELYLAESLGVPWDRVHAEAEVLEHVLSEELEDLIAAKLGNPTRDPHGDPIPTRDLVIEETPSLALSSLEPGATGTFVRISDSDPAMLRYLAERGIAPGDPFEVIEKQPFGGPLFASFGDARPRPRRPARRRDARGGRGVSARRRRAASRAPALAARAGAARQRAAARSATAGAVRGRLAMLGPAFVAAVAYIDPGNFATNIAGGAKYGFLLVWVIIAANLMAMLVQYLSAKVGVATGRSLPGAVPRALPAPRDLGPVGAGGDHRDRDRPGRVRRRGDRAQPAVRRPAVHRRPDDRRRRVRRSSRCRRAATAASSSRSPRCSGSCCSASLYDLLARRRRRRARSPAASSPASSGTDSILLAVGILGATVMPHVVYLHSALTQSRIKPENDDERRELMRFQRVDVMIAMGLAGIINLTMLVVAAELFHDAGKTNIDSIEGAHAGLNTLLGGGAALAFAVALLASGLSSSSVGTYAGQVVMQGFINFRIPLFLRRAITMIPALVVLAIGARRDRRRWSISQVVLSFGIPFALVPMILLTRRADLMGALVNRPAHHRASRASWPR